MNRRQAERLKRLSDYLHSGGPSQFMFELLVPATPAQLERSGGDKKEYDRGLRPELMVQAITELQDAGIEPDVWKIEGIDRPEDCDRVVAAVRRGGRDRVGCIVLGRGEDDAKVRQWLKTAAAVPGFIGFAVGRTSFWEPLTDWKEGRIAREAAVSEIARRYREWVDIFEAARAAGAAAIAQGGTNMTVPIDKSPAIKSQQASARRDLHQHDPHPRHRRDPGRQLGPPRNAHGDGPGRLLPLAVRAALRPAGPDLAEPRPLRALGRPRLDAALRAACT